jgi:glutaredoxin 3
VTPNNRVIALLELIPGLTKEINMNKQRKVEVFSAGCAICEEVVHLVKASACPSCDVTVLDTNDVQNAQRAKALGISRVPAVVIDGKLADCCAGGKINAATLKAAGLGQAAA